MHRTDDRLMTTRGRHWYAALLAMLVLLLAPATATAQPAAAPNILATLDAEGRSIAPGGETTIALSMMPQPGWHGYWKNGGDAGFGVTVRWTLPDGVTVSDLAYPVPGTLMMGAFMNHVYEAPYALLARLRLAAGVAPGARLPIVGEAEWLACTDRVCVPGRARLTLDLVAGTAAIAPADRQRFDGWRAALPQPLGSDATFARVGSRLRIAVPLPATLTVSQPHLFVATARANQAAAAQSFSRVGDTLVIETAAGADLAAMTRFDALLKIGDGRGLAFAARPGAVPAAGVALAAGNGAPVDAPGGFDAALFFTALAGAIVGGLILNVMPCVFPILSLKAMALVRAGGDARGVRQEGIAYTAGAVLTCLALGAILLALRASGESLGWAFQLQRPESVLLLIILTGTITANLAGLFEFSTVDLASGRSGTAPRSVARDAFATGALAAFVATPCSGPFLGAALGATLVLPAWAALPVFGGLGLGLALPFLALAFFPALRARLPRPGPWMARLQRWLAVPMALTALALVWLLGRQTGSGGWLVGAGALGAVAAAAWWAGRRQHGGRPAGPALLTMAALLVPLALALPTARAPTTADGQTSGSETVERWSAQRVATLQATGQPAFVYFTADWCVSCKVNEAAAIDRVETAAAFKAAGVRVLRADWTNADADITRELARHGRNSVPLYLWYPRGGGAAQVLPQLLTPGVLTGLAEAPGNAGG